LPFAQKKISFFDQKTGHIKKHYNRSEKLLLYISVGMKADKQKFMRIHKNLKNYTKILRENYKNYTAKIPQKF